jgi:hypothetical protein
MRLLSLPIDCTMAAIVLRNSEFLICHLQVLTPRWMTSIDGSNASRCAGFPVWRIGCRLRIPIPGNVISSSRQPHAAQLRTTAQPNVQWAHGQQHYYDRRQIDMDLDGLSYAATSELCAVGYATLPN